MVLAKTCYEHVAFDKDGAPIVAGTTMKIVELVAEKMAYGWSPEELHFQHPYLTVGQIYAALAYYWDHADELEQDIKRRLSSVERLRQASDPSPLVARLKAKRTI